MEGAQRAGAMVTEQIRAITHAAEAQASEIRREADEDAEGVRQESRRAASGILERLDQLESAVQQVVVGLRREADAVNALLERSQFSPSTSGPGGGDTRSALVVEAEVVEEPPHERSETIPGRTEDHPDHAEPVDAEVAEAGSLADAEPVDEDRDPGPAPADDPSVRPADPDEPAHAEMGGAPEATADPEAPEPPESLAGAEQAEAASQIGGAQQADSPESPLSEPPEEPASPDRSPTLTPTGSMPEPEVDHAAEELAEVHLPVEPEPSPSAEPEPAAESEPAAEPEPYMNVDTVEPVPFADLEPDPSSEGESPPLEVTAPPSEEAATAQGSDTAEPPLEPGDPAIGAEAGVVQPPEPESAEVGPSDEPGRESAEPTREQARSDDPPPRRSRLRSLFRRGSNPEATSSPEPGEESGQASSPEGAALESAEGLAPGDDDPYGPAPAVIQPGWWEEPDPDEDPERGLRPAELFAPEGDFDDALLSRAASEAGAETGEMAGPPLTPGAVVEGYRVDGVIGRQSGGGIVYAATEVSTGEPLALKTLPEAIARDEAGIERFVNDVSQQRALDHPNIVRTRGGEVSEGRPFLVMDLVSGTSLKNLIVFEEVDDHGALALLLPVAEALDRAGEMGFPHRDLRPSKIIVSRHGEGRAMLGDFGAGKPGRLPRDELSEHLETPDYAAPEQLLGEPLSPASNVYSLAAILFECFAGRLPFLEGDARVANPGAEPEALSGLRPDLPEKLDQVLRGAMAEDPSERPGTAGELVREVQDALAHPP